MSSSCTWQKCQATGIILSNYRINQNNSTSINKKIEDSDVVIARLLDEKFIEIVISKIKYKDNNNE